MLATLILVVTVADLPLAVANAAPPSICLHFNASRRNCPSRPPARPGTGMTHHDDGRPLLGRNLRGKSQRELST